LTAEFNWRKIDFVFPNQSSSLFFVPMKKRPVKWPLGNPVFIAWEVEAAAGLLVARRNHALVCTGQRLCQGWDLWLDGKFVGALNSRTLGDLATLSRDELLRVTRAACCGRHREFQPDQPRLQRHPKGGPRPNAGRRPKGAAKRVKLNLTLSGQTVELIDARRGEQTRGEYLDSLVLSDPPSSS
jgi:hypothetical protein